VSARPASGRGPLVTALAAAQSWFLEPAVPVEKSAIVELSARPVVLVMGLAPGCGATMVARALGAELARRDPGGAAAVGGLGGGAPAVGTQGAGRLARTLANLSEARPRPLGRLCVTDRADPRALADALRYLAPLVLEAGAGETPAALAALADRTVLVGGPGVEPALAAVVSASLSASPAPSPARAGDPLPPVVVANRVAEAADWDDRAELVLPESRLGARLALGGREPRGELGRGIRALADRCEVP